MRRGRLFLSFSSIFLLSLSLNLWNSPSLAMEEDEKNKNSSIKLNTVSDQKRERVESEDDIIYSPSTPPQNQLHAHSFKGEKQETEVVEGEFFIKQLHLLSSSLKIVDFALLMEEPKEEETNVPHHGKESAQFTISKLEEPGDIRNGIFLILESIKRPHRYHAKFFSFDLSKYTDTTEASFLIEDKSNNNNLKLNKMLKTPRKITLDMCTTLVTKTKPNKLILQIEEKDKRYFSSTQDFFGRIRAKFEDDPFAMICLLTGGISRITKAVLSSGSSEIEKLL